ncbi:MAG TPA: hypothetical protein VN671_03945, partial [Solirubrobacterales bacterium]|nr:hypothetical protein [Solirubrobacterales bacterium]
MLAAGSALLLAFFVGSASAAEPTLTMSTRASAGVTVGTGFIRDTAIISGGVNPGGTITFRAYGPHDPNCTSTPAFTSYSGWAPVNGDGEYTSVGWEPME